MPSASTKIEKLAQNEADTHFGQVLIFLEKKVRNLEKRKGKLDAYREESRKGTVLNEDQLQAVAKYGEVIQMLEFAKEVQKSITLSQQESIKLSKKQARRELQERQHHELGRIKELLLIQDILNNMGTDVREDFMSGSNGAVLLSEEKLNRLDELYKLLSPSREDIEDENGTHDKQLSLASEHLVSLLDGKNKEVVGSTYKEMKDVIMSIHNSKYFESSSGKEVEEEEVAKSDETVNTEQDEKSEAASNQPIMESEVDSQESGQPAQQQIRPVSNSTSQAAAAAKGNFNFLQDSQIDLESPHMDPAVVAAHPMAPAPATAIPLAGFNQAGSNPSNEMTYHGESTPPNAPSITQQPIALRQSSNEPREEFNPNQPIPSQTFTNQSFNSTSVQKQQQQQSSNFTNNIQNISNQSVLGENQESGAPPPPIPLPSQKLASQEKQQPNTFSTSLLGFNETDSSQVFERSAATATGNHLAADGGSDKQSSQINVDSSSTGYNGHNRTTNYNVQRNDVSRPPRGNRGAGGGGYRGRGSGYQNGRGGGFQAGQGRDNYYQSNSYNSSKDFGNYRGGRGGGPRGAGGMRGGNRGGNRGGRGGYNRDQ